MKEELFRYDVESERKFDEDQKNEYKEFERKSKTTAGN